MNIFGIGNLEIIVILVVALLVLGPARMVDMARSLGRYWNEAQRTLRSVADAATTKLDEPRPPDRVPRDPMPGPEDAVARDGTASDDAPDVAGADQEQDGDGAATRG